MRCKDKLNRIEFFYFFGGLNYPNGKRKSIKSQNVAEQIAERFIDKYFQLKEEERFAEQTIVKAFQSIYKNNDSSTRIKLGEKMFNGFKNKARDELDIQSINYYIQKYNKMKFGHCAAWSFGKIPHGKCNQQLIYYYHR